jgi:hypothetical protein
MDLLASSWSGFTSKGEDKTLYQYVFDLKNFLADACEVASEVLDGAEEKGRRHHDKKAVPRSFQIGDEVLVLLPSDSNKLLMMWKGPYPVVDTFRSDYKVDINGRRKVFHANMLKKYIRRSEVSAVVSAPASSAESLPNVPWESIVSSSFDLAVETGCQATALLPVEESDPLPLPTVPVSSAEDIGSIVYDTPRLSVKKLSEIKEVFQSAASILTADPGVFLGKLDHEIRVLHNQPVFKKQYPLPFASKEIHEREVQSMLKLGVIEPSSSPYSAPVVLVKKPDGSTRVCIDFRALNKITVSDAEPIPDIEQLFAALSQSIYFTKIDLAKGYWQIRVKEEDKPKTAFQTPLGLFQWTRMPFGLVSAPATFARMMRMLHLERYSSLNFFDDILVHSVAWGQHLDHVKGVLNALKDSGLTVRPSKVSAGFQECDFLGHTVGQGCLRPDRKKISKILKVSTPTSRKQVRSLLGLVSYYRRFVPNLAELTAPISDLLKGKRGRNLVWSPACADSLERIQSVLSSSPVLKLPDLSRTFLVQTDASSVGIGGVLLQEHCGVLHPVCFVSRKLLSREERYSTIERECLAIVWTLSKLSRFLLGRPFHLQVDHAPLQYLLSKPHSNSRVMRWALSLQEFAFDVQHVSGEKNCLADFLSRSVSNQMIP